MPDWEAVAVMCAVPMVLGPTVDRFLLRRHKSRLYDILLYFWLRISETRITAMHNRWAFQTLKMWEYFFGKKIVSPLSFGICALISLTITTLVVISAAMLTDDDGQLSTATTGRDFHGLPMDTDEQVWKGIVDHAAVLLAINTVLDTLTIWITIYFIQCVASSRGLRSVAFICIDAVSAFGLAWIAGTLFVWIIYGWGLLESGLFSGLVYFIPFFMTGMESMILMQTWVTIAYSHSMLVPTMMFLIMLLLGILARWVLVGVKSVSMYFLEIATEKNPEELIVFTLTGTLFSVITILSKTAHFFST